MAQARIHKAKKIGFFRAPHFAYLTSASAAINILSLALPLMTIQIYDRIMVNHANDTLLVLSCGVIVAAFVEMLLRSLRNSIVSSSGMEFEHQASVEAVSRLIESEPRSGGDTTPAILVQDVTAASELKDYYGGSMAASTLVDTPFAVINLCLAFYLTGPLAFVTLGFLVIYGAYCVSFGHKLRRMTEEKERDDNMRFNFITQALYAIHSIKGRCLEAVTVRRFEKTQAHDGGTSYDLARGQLTNVTASYLAGQLMTVAIICAGVPLAVHGQITVGMLAACIMLSGQAMMPVQRAISQWMRLQEIRTARRRLSSVLNRPHRNFIDSANLQENTGTLKLDRVSFSFVEGQPVMDNVSLTIPAGEVVAISGAAGSGRTVIVELMAGLYTPDKGRVLVSGMDAATIPQAERSRYIGYLPTRGAIFSGSIMDNITGFDARLQREARDIAALLDIERNVALLPAGYDTYLDGLPTDTISPGLKQRIAIARSLIRHPKLILFDNADLGLDRESYAAIFTLLARLKRRATIVMVSDDRNLLSLADRAYEIRRANLVTVMEPTPQMTPRPYHTSNHFFSPTPDGAPGGA